MGTRRTGHRSRAILVAALALTAIVLPLMVVVADITAGWPSGGTYLIFAPVVVTFAAVGWLLALRRPDNVIGPLCLLFAWVFAIYFPIDILVRTGTTTGPVAVAAAFSSASDAGGFIVVAMILVQFPTGEVPGARWRWTVPASIIGAGCALVGFGLQPGKLAAFPITNPLGVPGFPGAVLGAIGYVVLVALLLTAVAALVTRWRRGTATERAQVKWVAAASAALLLGEAWNLATFDATDPLGFPLALVAAAAATALVPVAIGIAILRYRLYEIDRIISRTIAYAAVTAIVGVVFLGGILALQAILADWTQGETLAVAISTLGAFALFQPVRGRVQRAVDRRFNRARVDAERTTARFIGHLRDELVLERLVTTLTETADQVVEPRRASVWLRRHDAPTP